MSNENLNKNLSWRGKLDNLESTPGETFIKEAAWDKLHARLKGGPISKRSFWYWIAAACLLFALLMGFMNFYKDKKRLPGTESIVKPKIPVGRSLVLEKNQKIENIKQEPLPTQKTVATTSKIKMTNHRVTASSEIPKIHSDDALFDKVGLTIPTQIPVTVSNAIVIVPVKKKLEVVHINELSDPAIESIDVVRKIDKHFKVKLANEEVFANPIASKTSDFSTVKTKPFSN